MASAIWKKLNLKDEGRIAVIDAPDSFKSEVDSLSSVRIVRDLKKLDGLNFLIAFATRRKEIEEISGLLANLAAGDVTVWICYPKGSSKRYTCDFNRDAGWEPLGAAGFEGVRQVAIDADWSALRFRRVDFIKKMKRDPKRALTQNGKAKSLNGKS